MIRLPTSLLALIALTSVASTAQEPATTVEFDGRQAAVVKDWDDAFILETVGPQANYGSGTNTFYLQWFIVQDSSMGLVFKEPSGLKVSNEENYDGDIDVRALQRVHAFEVSALTFNVWDQHTGTYQMTSRRAFNVGDDDGFDPRWYDLQEKSGGHRASIVYISRVRLADGTILKANQTPIDQFAQSIDSGYTARSDERDITELMRLWRQFLREMQQILPGGGQTALHMGEWESRR